MLAGGRGASHGAHTPPKKNPTSSRIPSAARGWRLTRMATRRNPKVEDTSWGTMKEYSLGYRGLGYWGKKDR